MNGIPAVQSPLVRDMSRAGLIRDPYAVPSKNVKSVLVPFNEAGIIQKSYYFAPDNSLRGDKATIKAIEIADVVTQAVSSLPTKDVLPVSVLADGVLYMSNDKREIFATIPLYLLVRRLNNGILFMTEFTDQVWDMCYLEFTTVTSITDATGIVFNVYYDPK